MDTNKVIEFQKGQASTVAKIGAFVTCLEAFSKFLDCPENENNEISEIRRLQQIVGSYLNDAGDIKAFLKTNHLSAYSGPLISNAVLIANSLAVQTLPSARVGFAPFKDGFNMVVGKISEAMVALAQVPPPSIDVNLKAGNAFTAYCFLKSIINTSTTELIIVDPYIDETVFYRYFSDLNKDISITVVSDNRKLKGKKLAKYEAVEEAFKKQYSKYTREMRNNLHDRYLITETNGYKLGGSIIHAAYKSDYSIQEISPELRQELVNKYT